MKKADVKKNFEAQKISKDMKASIGQCTCPVNCNCRKCCDSNISETSEVKDIYKK